VQEVNVSSLGVDGFDCNLLSLTELVIGRRAGCSRAMERFSKRECFEKILNTPKLNGV